MFTTGTALVAGTGLGASRDEPTVDPSGTAGAPELTSSGGSDGHDAGGTVGSVAGRNRSGWTSLADRLGGDPVSLAEGPLSGYNFGVDDTTASGVSSRRALECRSRSRLSERNALCAAPRWRHGL